MGVVVQLLGGIDRLEKILEVFGPNDWVCVDALVDHLAPGLKGSQIVGAVTRHWREDVLVLSHSCVDIWQTVKPSRLGLGTWPQIGRGVDVRHGTLEVPGWPHENQVDIAMGWKWILSRMHNHKDLEPTFLGRVEELVGLVITPGLS